MITDTVYGTLAFGSVIKEDKNWFEYQHLRKVLILYFPDKIGTGTWLSLT